MNETIDVRRLVQIIMIEQALGNKNYIIFIHSFIHSFNNKKTQFLLCLQNVLSAIKKINWIQNLNFQPQNETNNEYK